MLSQIILLTRLAHELAILEFELIWQNIAESLSSAEQPQQKGYA